MLMSEERKKKYDRFVVPGSNDPETHGWSASTSQDGSLTIKIAAGSIQQPDGNVVDTFKNAGFNVRTLTEEEVSNREMSVPDDTKSLASIDVSELIVDGDMGKAFLPSLDNTHLSVIHEIDRDKVLFSLSENTIILLPKIVPNDE